MEKFYDGLALIAIRVRTFGSGTTPITGPEEPLQVLGVRRRKGAEVVAHRYVQRRRITNQLQKCLLVREGRAQVTLYGTDDTPFKRVVLKTGDIFILLRGGYRLKFLAETDMVEIKSGPYYNDRDKILLKP